MSPFGQVSLKNFKKNGLLLGSNRRPRAFEPFCLTQLATHQLSAVLVGKISVKFFQFSKRFLYKKKTFKAVNLIFYVRNFYRLRLSCHLVCTRTSIQVSRLFRSVPVGIVVWQFSVFRVACSKSDLLCRNEKSFWHQLFFLGCVGHSFNY